MNSIFLLQWSNLIGDERIVSTYKKFFTSKEIASVFAEQYFSENREMITDCDDEWIDECISVHGDKPEDFTWDKFIHITEMEKQQ
jgi:hypothetical protein